VGVAPLSTSYSSSLAPLLLHLIDNTLLHTATAVHTGYKRESDGATVLLLAQLNSNDRPALEEAMSDLYSHRFTAVTQCSLHEYVFDVPAKTLLSHSAVAVSPDARPFELPSIGELATVHYTHIFTLAYIYAIVEGMLYTVFVYLRRLCVLSIL
jgi:hypothetical protein